MSKIIELDKEMSLSQSWIQSYMKYTESTAGTPLFRTWAAVWAVSGLLERKVWIQTSSAPLYPNLFVLFVAPPGIGKGMSITPMREILTDAGRVNLAPSSISNKGMLDYMNENGKKVFVYKGQKFEYNSLLISSNELGVLLPKNDSGMISMLCDLYDCGDVFNERIRGQNKTLKLIRPHLHLLAATQPKYLHNLLPDDMFQQGITARMILVYSSEVTKNSLFGKSSKSATMKQQLIQGARKIAAYIGPIEVDEKVKPDIEHCYLTNDDGPEHSKLQHYNTRRIIHTLKVAMAFSASAMREKLVITEEDWKAARKLILSTENYMEEIFKEMSTGGQRSEIEEAFIFLLRLYSQRQKPIPESMLISFLSSRIPTYQIANLIDVMVKGKIIDTATGNTVPGERMFVPKSLDALED